MEDIIIDNAIKYNNPFYFCDKLCAKHFIEKLIKHEKLMVGAAFIASEE